MSVRLHKRHDTAFRKGTTWDVNGELGLFEAADGTYFTVDDLRRGEWKARAYAILEKVARELDAFVRIDTTIDGARIVIDARRRDEVRAAIAERRLSTGAYEHLTRDDAHTAVMERVLALGEDADWTSIDEDLVADRFPLGYRARTAIEELEARGALRLVRAKGRCRLVPTDVGRAMITAPR